MQFKSFMEALKGKQHKIDKNKNGEIDAHDFKLLRKEEEELEESEERMARADYKVGASGRKSHKEIVFNDAESKDDKEEMKEAKMSDADMAERERIVKGMKKNLTGFKARYGDRAKEVMYATATKQAMKEETVEEAVQKADIPAYLRKQQGQTPLKLSDLKRKDTISDKENLAKARGVKEEAEVLDELRPLTYMSYHNKATAIGRDGEKAFDKSGKDRSANIAKADKRVIDSVHGKGPLAKLYPTAKKTTLGKKAQAAIRSNAQWNEEAEELEEGDLSVRTLYNKFADAHVNGNDTKPTEKAITKVHGDVVMAHMKKAARANAKGDMDGEERHFDNAQTAAKKTDRIGGTVGRGRSEFMKNRIKMAEEVEQIDERSDQAKRNKIMKNVMAASKGAQINRGLKLDPAEYGYKRAQNLNVAIGRAAMKAEEVKKDDVPFDGPYTKTKPVKNSDGTTQSPMSRARALAKDAMKKQMKEDIDRLFEKDEQEYGYEGDMAMNQLATLTRCAEMIKDTLKPDTDLPEWVQSKITLASDYIVTAADYLHSELEEGYYEKPASAYRRKGDEIGGGSHAPVAPVPDKKYIKGTPEHKAYKATKKPINGMPTNNESYDDNRRGFGKRPREDDEYHVPDPEMKKNKVKKESFDADGNIINSKVSYKEFAMMLEYEAKDGRYVHKGSYGGNYVDPEGADDADDKKPKQQPADKRGRGRPAGAKSGARKITGTSKLFK